MTTNAPPQVLPPLAALDPESFITIQEAAIRLGVSVTSAWALVRSGRLESVKFGHRSVRIVVRSVQAYRAALLASATGGV